MENNKKTNSNKEIKIEGIKKEPNQVICWFCQQLKNKKDCLQSSPDSFICKECFTKKRFIVRSRKPVKQESTLEKALKQKEKLYEIENQPVFGTKEQLEISMEVSREERKEKRRGEKQAKGKKTKEELDIWEIPY